LSPIRRADHRDVVEEWCFGACGRCHLEERCYILLLLHLPILISLNYLVAVTAKLEGLHNRCPSQEGGCDMEGRSMDAPFLCFVGGCS
jgi:hypothetical protein